MHNHASTDGAGKRPDMAEFRAVVTADPHRWSVARWRPAGQGFATGFAVLWCRRL